MSELSAGAVATVFGISVRQIREKRGWSQSELARRMQQIGWDKYSQVAVSRTEEGTRVVRLDEAFALAEALLCKVSDLLTPDRTAQELRESRDAVRHSAYAALEAIEDYFMQRSILQEAYDRAKERLETGDPLPEALVREIESQLAFASIDLVMNYPDYDVEDDPLGDD